ncbi:DNA end-binding protein Ku [Amycolatopsis arida]|uniref:Non-homologous end joining protein Ku n=1 Tax=Amycolatopsis arida TaxID=587909 RepID=A0A1I5YH49_9PSEU|nr:Ku protein [Amycolatopsis arida]TDX90511.1 DNA end-binding protein Ku [Amycolatopsis arida]SFQ43528.1 DNA end-binding protein Ku [Amycolatopsis arida]
MARPIWSGALNFGLVTVPVQLYSATEDHTVHFRQFQRGTSDRIRYKRVNERTGKEVDYSDIVKGYELDDGEYVLIERDELEEIAPGRSRTIDIDNFVDLDEIDPIHFQKSYWLAPAKKEFARAYGLLLEAMRDTNRAGIARFVMRNKEYLAAVRAGDDLLVLDTLLFADEVRNPAEELRDLPEPVAPRGRELDMAVSLIESMSDEWRPERYRDNYTERVKQLIEDKRSGRTVTPEEGPPEPTKVVDLFEALSRSVQSRKKGGKGTREPARREPDLSELTKAELERMARDLDVKGRSKMSRAQLERAVRAARPRRKRAS